MLEESGALLLRCVPVLKRMTDDEFFELCQENHELHIERTSAGDLVIMPPTGSEGGIIEGDFGALLNIWTKRDGTGVMFSPSAGFALANGAVRSPDASWIEGSRWNALPPDRRKKFAAICPDFMAEIRSSSDALVDLQDKMAEYIANGARVGWLIDPIARTLHVYAPSHPVQVIDDPQVISVDPVLPGFSVDFPALWRKD